MLRDLPSDYLKHEKTHLKHEIDIKIFVRQSFFTPGTGLTIWIYLILNR